MPDWVVEPLGDYYLYFSHHKGDHLRLAYANHPNGPWTLYEAGILAFEDSGFPASDLPQRDPVDALMSTVRDYSISVWRDIFMAICQSLVTAQQQRKAQSLAMAATTKAHIASPEIVVDNNHRQIEMFYHGQDDTLSQSSRVALSHNGIDFRALDGVILGAYLRSLIFREAYYLLGAPGILYRSDRLLGPFEAHSTSLLDSDTRHTGIWLDGDTLRIVWSRVGDATERILLSSIDLSNDDWNQSRATASTELIRPMRDWEGANQPLMPSFRGEMGGSVNQLRDPFIFQDQDGQLYLVYTGGVEQAIGIVQLERE